MKWIKTTISVLQKTANKHFYVLILLFIFSNAVTAQTYKFSFQEEQVSEALSKASTAMGIRISFDASKLSQFRISGEITGNTPDEVLQKIVTETNFFVEKKYGTYLLIQKNETQVVESKPISVQGVVFDKASGEQLPYATLVFENRHINLFSSANGSFGIQLKDSSALVLNVQYLGYHTLDTVLMLKNEQNFFRLGMKQKMQTLQLVEVAGEKLQMIDQNNQAGHFAFNPMRFADLPNYGETDVFRALQLLPGISSTENSSQLNIRGSSADQNLVLFDGFTLYNLDHFFGVFSALNPYVIKNIQVYRGGFDPRYGERVSGIVDITSKSGNQLKPEIYGGINLISANLAAELPLTKKLTLVAATRRAYTDIYSSWLADALLASKTGQPKRLPEQEVNTIEPDFFFSDINLKLSCNIATDENISISTYGAKDYLNSSDISQRANITIDTEDINKWGNYGFGISWKKQWSAKSFTNLQAGHSGYFNDYSNNTQLSADSLRIQLPQMPKNLLNILTNETNNLTDYFVSFQNNYIFNKTHQIEWGTAAKYNQFQYYKDATRDFIYSNLDDDSWLFSVFTQDKISLNSKLAMKPGFRMNWYNKTGKAYFEPRLAASYSTSKYLTWKAAAGKYYQFLNKSSSEQTFGYNRDFWVLADGNQNPVISSNHLILGGCYEKENLFFDVEVYYKSVKGLQEYLFLQNPQQKSGEIRTADTPNPPIPGLSRFISGTGQAMGIDFLAKYETTRYTSWLSYSLSKATQNFDQINSGANIPSAFDQTHQVKWTNIYSVGKWNFSSLALFSTGQPYISSTSKEEDFNTTRVYNRLPDYFRIDISGNYKFNIGKVNVTPGFSVINLLNTENYLDAYIRNFDFNGSQGSETTLVKAQEVTLNFYVNFRF